MQVSSSYEWDRRRSWSRREHKSGEEEEKEGQGEEDNLLLLRA